MSATRSQRPTRNAKIYTMDHSIMKINKNIHVVQVRCNNCSGPHLTKDYELDVNGNKEAQLCYSSGDKYDED